MRSLFDNPDPGTPAVIRSAEPESRRIAMEEEALKPPKQPQARMRAIFDTSRQYIGILAPGGTLVDANLTSLRAIGAKRGEVAGKPYWDTPWFTGTPGLPGIVKAGVLAVAKGGAFREDVLIDLPEGIRWFDLSLRPISGTGGEITVIVAEAADITLRRQKGRELHQSRRIELAGWLAGRIAHDFNNLLTPIAGGLDLVQRRLKGDVKSARLLSGAIQSANRASRFAKRLAAFVQEQHPDADGIDVQELVAGMRHLLARTAGAGVELRAEIEAGLPLAKAGYRQLELALLCLVARMRAGIRDRGAISIAAKLASVSAGAKEPLPCPYVCLCLSNSGAAAPSAEQLAEASERLGSGKEADGGGSRDFARERELAARAGAQFTLQGSIAAGITVILWLPALEILPRLEAVSPGTRHAVSRRRLSG